jgi:GlpG protein
MRQIGHLDREAEARVFGDYLYAQGIDNEVEPEGAGWVVWVRDEERLEEGRRFLEAFRANPGDRRYARAGRDAQRLREQARQETVAASRRFFNRDHLFPDRRGLGRVTLVLIGLSLLVTALTEFGSNGLFLRWLSADLVTWQVWRWVTPIFVHLGFIHILFNMMMTADFGRIVEARLGAWRFLGLVLLIAIPSNLAQLVLRGPLFGGMSGVIYGFLGYCWVRGRLDPASGLALNPTSLAIMMVWYVLCLVGVIPNVANVVHTVGLGMGMMCGLITAQLRARR